MCQQYPSVDENQHAEAERRHNRHHHHQFEISTSTPSRRGNNRLHSRDTQHACQNLGVAFDSNMSLERHVSRHVSIGRIRRYLEQGHTKQLVHALVILHFDCCNSLLNGLSVAVVDKLRRVQNACARIILIRSKRDHITSMLLELLESHDIQDPTSYL